MYSSSLLNLILVVPLASIRTTTEWFFNEERCLAPTKSKSHPDPTWQRLDNETHTGMAV